MRLRRPSIAAAGFVRRIAVISGVAILAAAAGPAQEGESSSFEIEILGTDVRLTEGSERQWAANLVRRATESSAAGYEPVGVADPVLESADGQDSVTSGAAGATPLTTEWELPVTFRWDFGDGRIVETGERPSLTHAWEDAGDYTITVEAWNENGLAGRGTRSVTVGDLRPYHLRLSAVEIDPAEATFELTASVGETIERDVLEIHWDFGDGEQDSGALEDTWRVTHDYPLAGTYPVTITITDDEGTARSETLQIVAVGGGETSDVQVDSPDETATDEAVSTGFEAKVSGGLQATLDGEIRSYAGLHLGPVDDGRRCRFTFTAWDPSRLASVAVIADLAGLPEAGGGVYTFRPGGVWLTFSPHAEHYQGIRQSRLRQFADRSLGERIGHMTDLLPGSETSRLAREVGVEGGPREDQGNRGAPPAASPLGIAEAENFKASGGTFELTFVPHDRALGEMNLTMANTDEESPHRFVSLRGTFALDLEAARRDGMMLYERCNEAAFRIEEVDPVPEEQNLSALRPRIEVEFSENYDVATLDESAFRLTYPAAGSGEPVPVPSRLFRSGDRAFLQPVDALWGGVEYTARIRTGEDGVRGRNGVALDDEDGTGWYSWSFTTRVDVKPGPGETENLSCHVFQTVRDAPLIAGKPAVARLYADWKRYPEVHPDAQTDEFVARVILKNGSQEVASDFYRFVHPDRWKAKDLDTAKAEHTANVFWTPDDSQNRSLRVTLEVPQAPGEDHGPRYWTRCVTPMWEHQPELTVEYYVLAINEWQEPQARAALAPVVNEIVNLGEVFAEQVFPLKSVFTRPGGVLEFPLLDRAKGERCDNVCGANLLFHHASGSTADVILAFGPQDDDGTFTGGGTLQRLDAGQNGVVVLAIDGDPSHRDRFVEAMVHEIGHVLGLQHLPSVNDAERFLLKQKRDEAWENDSTPVHWHQGIEGFRIARDGRRGWNKSSSEGNQEGTWLTPLMFPVTIPYRETFIARHQYLDLQALIDARGGSLR